MKWIYFLLFFISIAGFGQSDDSAKYIHYPYQYGIHIPRLWADSVLKAKKLVKFTGLTPSVDTTTYKPLTIDASGNVSKMSIWPVTDTGNLSNRIDLKLNISDTTNKWINDIRRSNDSVYALKNGSWQFKYIDNTGGAALKQVNSIEALKAETGAVDSFIMVKDFGYFRHVSTYETNGQYTIKANNGSYWELILNTNTNPYLNRKVNIAYGTRGTVIGNSISQTGGPLNTYPDHMKIVIGGGLSNFSIAGSTSINIGNMLRNDQIPISRTGWALFNNGINSIRFLKNDTMKQDMLNMYRAFLCNAFRRSTIDASAATQVSGTWAAWTGLTSTVVSKTNCMLTTDSAATLRFTLNGLGNIFGAYVSFITNLYTESNVWSDSVDIKDNLGNLLATVDLDRKSAHGKTPVVVFIPREDLGASVTYIEVINRRADTLIVDFAGSMKPNYLCEPAMIADITKVADFALQPGIGHDWWDEINQAAADMVENEFQRHGYPVTTLPLNEGFNPNDTAQNIFNDSAGIHPSGYAHQFIFMKNVMKRVNLVTFIKDTVISVPNAAAYTATFDVYSNPSRKRIFVLPTISQNSTLQLVSETAPSGNGFTAYGQEQIIINNNTSSSFSWSPLNWTLKDNYGASVTSFQNNTIYHFIFEPSGYRLINKYGSDSAWVDGDSIRIRIDGKNFAVLGGGGGSSLTSTFVGYGSGTNALTGEAAFTYDETTNTLQADTIKAQYRIYNSNYVPFSGTDFTFRRVAVGHALSLRMANSDNTALLTLANDASANSSIAANAQLAISAGTASAITMAHRVTQTDSRTGITASSQTLTTTSSNSFNTTSGALTSTGLRVINNAGRSAGSNALTNIGMYVTANISTAQVVQAGIVENATAITNAISRALKVSHTTSGVAATGFGAGMEFENENASGTNIIAAQIDIPFTDATNGSENGDMVFKPIRAGTITEGLRILSTGAVRFNNAYTFPTADGTAGQLLQTNASGAISFGNVGVANGGTGNTSLTAYALMAGGTTSTGATQQVSGTGTSEQVLVSAGASALPSWQTSRLKGQTTWDPASIGANSSTTTSFTVTGAALGDPVVISKTSGSYSNGEVYFAYVSAADTVTIQLQNTSGGTFDIASATFNVIVMKYTIFP